VSISLVESKQVVTTIVAIDCPDGIVMASDSQATQKVKTKTLGVTKIFNVNNFMGVGGSRDADNIELCVGHLTQELPRMSPTENVFRDKIENVFLHLHKKYNNTTYRREKRGQ
jgi:20S proteasome alpha/beta subunit